GVAAFFDVCNLGGGIVGSAVKHRDGNHRGQIVGEAAGEEEIKACMLVIAAVANVLDRMPRIDGGSGVGVCALARVFRRRSKIAAGIHSAEFDLLDGVANAIADVGGVMLVASA